MISDRFIDVWEELRKNYPKQIKKDEFKLGKTWVLKYRFCGKGVDISVVVRDAISLDIGRTEVIFQLISKLREACALSDSVQQS